MAFAYDRGLEKRQSLENYIIVSKHSSVKAQFSVAFAHTYSSIAIWGLMVQTMAYAVIIPIYLIIHLSTSPTVVPNHVSDFDIDLPNIASIPLAMFVGYLLPTILMSLPAPSILGFGQKQTLMAIWQAFPLWVAILQQILPLIMLGFIDATKKSPKSQVPLQSCSMGVLRTLYIGLLIIAGVSQISTATLLVTSKWFPDLFAPKYADVFNLSNVFLPVAISASTKMPSIGSGTLLLLQFDEYIGSTSMALWTSVLYLQAYGMRGGLRAFARNAAWCVGLIALTGPIGYAVACIWARDEIVFAKVEEQTKKSQ